MTQSKHLDNAEYYLAEAVQDYIDSDAAADETVVKSLLEFRNDLICKRSENQEYLCDIETTHGYCCDTCLQAELHRLWKLGIRTVGSCCGHGGKYQAYIQVLNKGTHVDRMLALGYEQIPPDVYGNGQACFRPKSRLLDVQGTDMEG